MVKDYCKVTKTFFACSLKWYFCWRTFMCHDSRIENLFRINSDRVVEMVMQVWFCILSPCRGHTGQTSFLMGLVALTSSLPHSVCQVNQVPFSLCFVRLPRNWAHFFGEEGYFIDVCTELSPFLPGGGGGGGRESSGFHPQE